jgi:hypothetical protein
LVFMVRVPSRRERVAIGYRARLVLVGAIGAMLLFGALSSGWNAGAASSPQDQRREPASYVVQHAATVTSTASNPGRSHRIALPGTLLVVTCWAAMAACRVAYRRRRSARRRIEQFHVRLRGPPHLLVAR